MSASALRYQCACHRKSFAIKFGYNAHYHWLKERVLSDYKNRRWAKAVTPIFTMSDHFANLSINFFSLIESEISEQASREITTEELYRGWGRKSSKRKRNGQCEFWRFVSLRSVTKIRYTQHSYSVYSFVFKIKQKKKTGIIKNTPILAQLSKFILIMTVSEWLRSCWSPSRLVHRGDEWRSDASLRNYIVRLSNAQLRACSDILSGALSGRPHQSQQPNFTALSSPRL